MSSRPRRFWDTYYGYLLCRLFGHSRRAILQQKGNEECDCGADHTYVGAPVVVLQLTSEGEGDMTRTPIQRFLKIQELEKDLPA